MYGTTPRKILGYQILAAIAFSLFVLWLIPAMGGSLILAVVLAVAAGVGGLVRARRTTSSSSAASAWS